jgi:hypothetical protein
MMAGVVHCTKFYNCKFYLISVLIINFYIKSCSVERAEVVAGLCY